MLLFESWVKLGRGFEPLGKGLKPFALAWLCHSSWSFSRIESGGGRPSSRFSWFHCLEGGGVLVVLAPLSRSFRTGESVS